MQDNYQKNINYLKERGFVLKQTDAAFSPRSLDTEDYGFTLDEYCVLHIYFKKTGQRKGVNLVDGNIEDIGL